MEADISIGLIKLCLRGSRGLLVDRPKVFPGEWFALFGSSIPNGKLIAGFEKIGRHTAAHRPEAKITDFLYHFFMTRGLFTLVYLPCPQRDQRRRY
jgi:hypothetical protein